MSIRLHTEVGSPQASIWISPSIHTKEQSSSRRRQQKLLFLLLCLSQCLIQLQCNQARLFDTMSIVLENHFLMTRSCDREVSSPVGMGPGLVRILWDERQLSLIRIYDGRPRAIRSLLSRIRIPCNLVCLVMTEIRCVKLQFKVSQS